MALLTDPPDLFDSHDHCTFGFTAHFIAKVYGIGTHFTGSTEAEKGLRVSTRFKQTLPLNKGGELMQMSGHFTNIRSIQGRAFQAVQARLQFQSEQCKAGDWTELKPGTES